MKIAQKPRFYGKIARFPARIMLVLSAISLSTLTIFTLAIVTPHHAYARDFRNSSLDSFRGPVVNDGRVVGLGGAFVSIAEGVAGHLVNPAAFAVRSASFTNTWFDWDVGASSLTAVGSNNDLDMSGNDTKGDAALANQLGFNLKFGRFGIGVQVSSQNHTLAVGPKAQKGEPQLRWEVDQSYLGIGFAWAFRDGEWVVGVLIGTAQGKINSPRSTDLTVNFTTPLHPSTFGLLWAPRAKPYRLGMSLRLPQNMQQADEGAVVALGKLTVPARMQMPGQFTIGASWMIGDRQPNIRPTYGRTQPLPGTVKNNKLRRQYALVTADLVLIGGVANGIGVRSYLNGVKQVSGDGMDVSVRVGAESEVMPGRLQVRTGAYFEPSRFSNSVGRMHWTAGGDVRVTVQWDWRINLMVDVAQRYQNVSLGFGLWH